MEPLTQEQARVIGCLLEKEATVPDTYPMTLNALRQACNQSSSRDPVVDYDEATVQRCLDELKAAGWVRFVHPSHGARTIKFRHIVGEKLGLEPDELAVLGVLALRGPQTARELRTRTERWHAFDSVDKVGDVLSALAAGEPPLTVELPREPGQHQTRWMHLLSDTNGARPHSRLDPSDVAVTDLDSAMVLALEEARAAEAAGEVPVGAVVIVDGLVVATGHNEREATDDPSAHAELLALRRACADAGSWRLPGATVVVTLEPCPMCAGAMTAARVGHVVFGAPDPKAGALGSLYNLGADPRLPHTFEVTAGVRSEECGELLRSFFGERRPLR